MAIVKKQQKKVVSKAIVKVLAEAPLNFTRLENKEWYPAKLLAAEVGEGKFGQWIRLEFEVTGGQSEDGEDAKGCTVSMFTDFCCAPGKLLYNAICALSGQKELDVDDELDVEAYYGEKVKVFVEDKVPKKGEAYNGRQNVTAVKALSKDSSKTSKPDLKKKVSKK